MDENTWRFAQTIMWLIGLQTAFLTAVIGFVWNNLSKRMDKLEGRIDKMDDRLGRLENDMVEVKTFLRMIEIRLQSHGHCLFNQEKPEKKAQ